MGRGWKYSFLVVFSLFLLLLAPSILADIQLNISGAQNNTIFFDFFNVSLSQNSNINQTSQLNLEWSLGNVFPNTSNRVLNYTNLVGYWKFNNESSSVIDISNYGNNGTHIAVGINWTSEGIDGGAYYFFGGNTSNGSINIPGSNSLNFSNGFTVAFWMYPLDNQSEENYEVIFDRANKWFKIAEWPLTYQFIYTYESGRTGEFDLGISGSVKNANKWTHVVLTYDGDYLKSYKNGKLIRTSINVSRINLTSTSSNFKIGQRAVGSYHGFLGSLDEIMFFNRELSSSEISNIYRLTKFNSDQVSFSQPINELIIDVNSTGFSPEIQVSLNGGSSWCEVISNRIYGVGCTVPFSNLLYRLSFNSNDTKLFGISLNASTNKKPQCQDGYDNDGDGFTDMVDPMCNDSNWNYEVASTCKDYKFLWDITGSWGVNTNFDSYPITFNQVFTSINFDGEYSHTGTQVPEEINLTLHLIKIKEGLEQNLPSNYSGYIIYDWEAWAPSWNATGEIYKNQSKNLSRLAHPDWPEENISVDAEINYNLAARQVWEQTVLTTKSLYPNSNVGFYGYPARDIYGLYDQNTTAGNASRAHNNELVWLWNISDVLFPTNYIFYASKEGTPDYYSSFTKAANENTYLRSMMRETKRVGNLVGTRPFVPYTMFEYHSSSNPNMSDKFMNDVDIDLSYRIPYEEGAQSVILWDWEFNNSQVIPYFNNSIGPYLLNFSKAMCGANYTPPVISCNDSILNGNETDIDCGGSECEACSNYARTFYVSSSLGSDSNNGITRATPWKTLSKVNGYAFTPGDGILFKRGDLWNETLVVNSSGDASAPITYSAYGVGNQPIISGFTTLSGWTNEGSGIYSKIVSSQALPNVVTINGTQYGMGRWPNLDYLSYESHTSNYAITDNGLGNATNWVGAEAVIRKNDWTLDRVRIIGHAGDTLTYSSLGGSTDDATNNYGYFIQNDIRSLDLFGEWYYNISNSKFFMYFGGENPQNYEVKISVLNNTIKNRWNTHITIKDLFLTGSIDNGVDFWATHSKFIIQNCTLDLIGGFGVYVNNGENDSVSGLNISRSNEAGIYFNYCRHYNITNNLIQNIGLIAGTAYYGTLSDGIYAGGGGTYDLLIANNLINNAGYNGIFCTGENLTVKNNFINNSCLLLSDCGGIYTVGKPGNKLIEGNIVLSSYGNQNGTTNTIPSANGIYVDAVGVNYTIVNNTCAYNTRAGLFFHESHNNIAKDNLLFDNREQFRLQFTNFNPNDTIRNIFFENNIMFAKTQNQTTMYSYSVRNDTANFTIANFNYYLRPINDTETLCTFEEASFGSIYRNISNWKSFSSQDTNSTSSPASINDTNNLLFVYNSNESNLIVILNETYIDAKGIVYTNNLTISPYRSVVLMKNYVLINATSNPSNSNLMGIDALKGVVFYEPFENLSEVQSQANHTENLTFNLGRVGNAAYFNESFYLSYNVPSNYNFSKGTIEMWVKPSWLMNDTSHNYDYLFHWSQGQNQFKIFKYVDYADLLNIQFRVDYNSTVWSAVGTTWGDPNINMTWNPDEWHNLKFFWDFTKGSQSYILIIVDNNYSKYTSSVVPLNETPTKFYVGGYLGYLFPGHTYIDELKIYNDSLFVPGNINTFINLKKGDGICDSHETSQTSWGDCSPFNASIQPSRKYLFFYTAPFVRTFEGSIPNVSTITDSFNVTLPKNNFETLFFNVYSRENTTNLIVNISDFIGSSNNISKSNAKLYVVKNWWQVGTTQLKSTIPAFVPELLLENDSLNLDDSFWNASNLPSVVELNYTLVHFDANTSKQFAIRVFISNLTLAGNYTANITFSNGTNVVAWTTYTIEVLPFSLEESTKNNIIYHRARLSPTYPDNTSEEIFRKEITDIKNHGFNGITIYKENNNSQYQRQIEIIRNNSINGMIIASMLWYPYDFIDTTNAADLKTLMLTYNLTPYFYGEDEPSISAARINIHINQSKKIHDFGGKVITAITKEYELRLDNSSDSIYTNTLSNYEPLDFANLQAYWDVNTINYLDSLANGTINKTKNETYYWQIMQENPQINRFHAGFYLWNTGLDGIFPYVYQSAQSVVYNDSADDSSYREHSPVYPSSQGPVPTIEWEALREGIDDTRYLVTWKKYRDLVYSINSTRAQNSDQIINALLQKYKSINTLHSVPIENYTIDRNVISDEILSLILFNASSNFSINSSDNSSNISVGLLLNLSEILSPINFTSYFTTQTIFLTNFSPNSKDKCWYILDGTTTFFQCNNQSVLSSEYANTTGVVGWWHLNEGNGTNISDSSSYGNNGSLKERSNTCANNNCPNWIDAKFGKGVRFNGMNNSISITDSPSLRLNGSMTLEGWVKINNLTKTSSLFGRGKAQTSGLNSGYFVSFGNSGSKKIYFDTYNDTTRDIFFTGEVITDSNWHFIVVTFDGTTNDYGKKIYVDGVLVGQATSKFDLITNSNFNFTIGADGVGSEPLDGEIDEVRVLNRALTQAEITRDYGIGIGRHNLEVYANSTNGSIGNINITFYTHAYNLNNSYTWTNKTKINFTSKIYNSFNDTIYNLYNLTGSFILTKTILKSNSTLDSSIGSIDLSNFTHTDNRSYLLETCTQYNNFCINQTIIIYFASRNHTYWWKEIDDSLRYVGDNYYTANTSSTLAWVESDILSTYLSLYESTLNTTYLDKFTTHFDFMLNNRREFAGDGRLIWAEPNYWDSKIGFETFDSDTDVFQNWTRVNASQNTIYLDSSIRQCGSSLKINSNATANTPQWITRQIPAFISNYTYSWKGYFRANNSNVLIKIVDETSHIVISSQLFNTSSSSFTYYYGDDIGLSFRAPENNSHNLTIWIAASNYSSSDASIWVDGCNIWGGYGFVIAPWVDDGAVVNGMILKPAARFVRIVKNKNLTEYQSKANTYLSFIEQNYVPVNNVLANRIQIREWQCGSDACMVFTTNGENYGGNGTLPLNRMFIYVDMLLDLYNVTQNQSYLNIINKTTFWLKNYGVIYDSSKDQYLFRYRQCTDQEWDSNGLCPRIEYEDNSHAQLELRYMFDAYKDGFVFNYTDMLYLTNTYKKSSWNQDYYWPKTNDHIQGDSTWWTLNPWNQIGWVHFSEIDYNLFYTIEKMFSHGGRSGSGAYYSIAEFMKTIDVAPQKIYKNTINYVGGRGVVEYAQNTGNETNITVVPQNSRVNVTVSIFDTRQFSNSISVNISASSDLSNNPTKFTICSLNATQNYTVKKDSVVYSTIISNQSGCIEFTNFAWSSHEFLIYVTNMTDAPVSNSSNSTDFLSNAIFGAVENISGNVPLILFVNESTNLSRNFTENLPVLFKDNSTNKTKIELLFNFSIDQLNLTKLNITVQENGSAIAFMSVKGLNLTLQNNTKTIYLDVISNSSKVCVQDYENTSLEAFTENCTSLDEVLLTCPTSFGGYNCTILNNQYKITGLRHTLVRELLASAQIAESGTGIYYSYGGYVRGRAPNTTLNASLINGPVVLRKKPTNNSAATTSAASAAKSAVKNQSSIANSTKLNSTGAANFEENSLGQQTSLLEQPKKLVEDISNKLSLKNTSPFIIFVGIFICLIVFLLVFVFRKKPVAQNSKQTLEYEQITSKILEDPNIKNVMNYISDAKKAGLSKNQIRTNLKNAGWKEEIIDFCLKK